MVNSVEARVSEQCRSAAEQIFDAWLNPTRVRQWMAASLRSMGLPGDIRDIEIDTRPGGRFLFSDQRGDTTARHWGTYLEIDPPRRLVFTWNVDVNDEGDPSRVTLSLEPAGSGCVATIVHRMDARWADWVTATAETWGRMLRASEQA